MTVRLVLKVVPGASRSVVAGWLGDTLKVRVSAPAERGKANAAVEALIAETLGVGSERVRIVAGRTSSRKIVEISSVSDAVIDRRLPRGRAC